MYTKIENAIHFVFMAFKDKKRSKEDIELSFHSISVGFMLKEINCKIEMVITGLLHDIFEDTNFNYEDIKAKFGEKIASNVLKVTENINIPDWHERKVDFINKLKTYNKDIIYVELADKLHNLLSDYELFLKIGKSALENRTTTYELNKWYYMEMQQLFINKLPSNTLLNRYNEIVKVYFGD